MADKELSPEARGVTDEDEAREMGESGMPRNLVLAVARELERVTGLVLVAALEAATAVEAEAAETETRKMAKEDPEAPESANAGSQKTFLSKCGWSALAKSWRSGLPCPSTARPRKA
jgi:hypothetical protein